MKSETLSTFEYIYRLWPVFVAFIGSLAWLLRIEAKQVYLEKTVKELNDRFSNNDKALWDAVNGLSKDLQKDIREILQSLGKIEGQLENKNH